jgi:cation diffusion facilitator CzcD-associated flavoprotein CzcO
MVWHLGVLNKATGENEHWIADFVCQCIGSLDRPKWGNTPGRENFNGAVWHTAHWNKDYDLTGKKVAIIGCGPSAAQIIPEIVDRTKHLTIYMRTPPVCVARNDFAYSGYVSPKCSFSELMLMISRQTVPLGHQVGSPICLVHQNAHEPSHDEIWS